MPILRRKIRKFRGTIGINQKFSNQRNRAHPNRVQFGPVVNNGRAFALPEQGDAAGKPNRSIRRNTIKGGGIKEETRQSRSAISHGKIKQGEGKIETIYILQAVCGHSRRNERHGRGQARNTDM